MSGEPFMMWQGRAIEWTMLHPAFKGAFAFGIHGAAICAAREIHPMFPTSAEIAEVLGDIEALEEGLK